MSSASGVGGVETWLARITAALPGKGYEPLVALTRGMQSNDPDRYKALNQNLPCIEVNGVGLPRSSRILACYRLIRRVNPSIVIPLGVIDSVPACGLAKLRGKRIRVICRTQGLLPPMLADLEEFASIFDFAVCNGLLNALYLEQVIGFPKKRIRHVPNGADRPTRARCPRRQGQQIRLLYLGRLTPGDKRATDLTPLVKELDALNVDYELKIVGDGPSRSVLERDLASHSNVSFAGSLPHEQVYDQILPATDVLVSLSSSESFGISIVEGMMHGIVPVSSRFLGHLSVGTIEDEVNALLFEIGDMHQAAKQIARLAKDSVLLESLGTQATHKASAKFSWESCISAWLDVLDEVSGQTPQSANDQITKFLRNETGRLDAMGLPVTAVDAIRRIRARIKPAVQPGGEEWPLYYRDHSKERLEQVSENCQSLENGCNPRAIWDQTKSAGDTYKTLNAR